MSLTERSELFTVITSEESAVVYGGSQIVVQISVDTETKKVTVSSELDTLIGSSRYLSYSSIGRSGETGFFSSTGLSSWLWGSSLRSV